MLVRSIRKGNKMKISNATNYSPNFKQLLCTSQGLNYEGKKMVEALDGALSYRPEIDELDKRGIDVIVYPCNDGTGNKAKVSIIDSDNKLFKHEGKDSVCTLREVIGHDDKGHFIWKSYDNYAEVMDYINSVLNGTAPKVTRVTKSLKEVLTHFPVRQNWLDNLFK